MSTSTEPQTTPNAPTNAKRILVADDEPYIRELYEEVLKTEGYQVDTASDGQEAFEKIIAGGYNAITLDVIMPKLDGLGILSQLKVTPPKQKNGPIILLTSLANDPAVKEAMQNGASKVVIKTDITPKQFTDLIKQVAT
ncbi:MAG: two-component system, OmpR family, response regulator CpxR [Patescibacteria group bacterium]|jgi:CheY-like chemotaxis protein|nr:two-component system, OmpR family, response regulator CpxR [Patescibacteria group bacterium]